MRRTYLLEAGVALATALSVGMLGVMLASPWLPQPRDDSLPAPTVRVTPAPAESEGPASVTQPIGLYLLRGAFSAGPCLALELGPEAYATDVDEGTATVLHWQRGRTGCDARSGDVASVEASVLPVSDDDEEIIGYALRFNLPLAQGSRAAVEITILANGSSQTLLQAVETSSQGSSGLVFDRVPSVQPTLNPLPSATPAAP